MFNLQQMGIGLVLVSVSLYGVVATMGATAVKPTKKHVQTGERTAPDSISPTPGLKNESNEASQQWGICHAGMKGTDPQAPGGFAPSKNLPQRIKKRAEEETSHGLYLLAQPNVAALPNTATDPVRGAGMRVLLVNRTDDKLAFEAADSRLSILQEALDRDGKWKPVESMPACFCGNSFHRVFLPSNHYWSMAARRYRGSQPTTLRFAMSLSDGTRIYSNTFSGSVNPGQFVPPPKIGIAAPAAPLTPNLGKTSVEDEQKP